MAGELPTKKCRLCLQTLSLSAFPSKYQTRDGHGPYCKPCNSAKRKLWREQNRTRDNASTAAYVKKNKAARKRWLANYRCRNRKRLSLAGKLYRQKNPHSHTQSEAKRRALARQLTIGSKEAIRAVYRLCASAQAIPCAYCGTATAKGGRHVEHKMPLSRGGAHSADNLAIACPDCNLRKGTLTAEEFAEGV
jgi:5-methylcytosine-specific restriction endonuclease McrA